MRYTTGFPSKSFKRLPRAKTTFPCLVVLGASILPCNGPPMPCLKALPPCVLQVLPRSPKRTHHSPAMEAELANHIWSLDELVGLLEQKADTEAA
jgi:hypothetical protein